MSKESKIKNILYHSFKGNKSIDFMIGNDDKSDRRYNSLLDYSIEKAKLSGLVYYDEESSAAALLIDHSKGGFSIKSLLLDLKLVWSVIGLKNLNKVLNRESKLKEFHPKGKFLHLWYIGVHPNKQGKGGGSSLLKKIITENPGVDIYLETSNLKNIPFYERNGFKKVGNIDLEEYELNMFKLE